MEVKIRNLKTMSREALAAEIKMQHGIREKMDSRGNRLVVVPSTPEAAEAAERLSNL